MRSILLLGCFLLAQNLFSQNSDKSYSATRVVKAPKVDGILDDEAWNNKPVATDFTQTIPYNGRKASQKTEVKIVYTDEAIFIGAMMYDTAPDSILFGLGKRDAGDDEISSDLFIVEFNPYNDDRMLNAFKLAASGVQIDEKVTYGNWDKSWDAIWYSKTQKVENGWVAEIKIPYSSLRLPNKTDQTWGMHLWRCIKRNEEWVSWNFVNEKEESTVHQVGKLENIKDVEPPLRLSFTPYFSGYYEHDGETNLNSYSFKGGLDLKYGINESYTLDMMIIPDFGQVQSDDVILNLSSVETYYDEKRSFFTEGTELFNKANIFYSRRIGAMPTNFNDAYNDLKPNEYVSENPQETQILNATKVSGRGKNGLAVGVLNAVTANTYATIKDKESGETREMLTQPWSNYNVLVLDQSLPNNSFVSFINTNVIYNNINYMANVTGTEFKFSNKSNMYGLFGKGALSQIYSKETDLGFYYDASFKKIRGNFKFDISRRVLSDSYNPTDLGYLANNNEIQNNLRLNYDIVEPFGRVLSWYNSVSFFYSRLYNPNQYAVFEINSESIATFRNQLRLGLYVGGTPVEKFDYYEPRVEGWKYREPTAFYVGSNMQTDAKKTLSLFSHLAVWQASEYEKRSKVITINPALRVNNKLTMDFNFSGDFLDNAIGFVDKTANEDTIYFGRRDANFISNVVGVNYIFNDRSSVSLRARHYWSSVEYKQFYILQEDGNMNTNVGDFTSPNINYNNFTMDLIYTWQFAPGSELSIMWKSNINHYQEWVDYSYMNNVQNTWVSPQLNTLSFRILYYLDYRYLSKRRNDRL